MRRTRWSVEPIFAWYDLWVGVFIDRDKRRVYVFPLPCLGIVINLPVPVPRSLVCGDPQCEREGYCMGHLTRPS